MASEIRLLEALFVLFIRIFNLSSADKCTVHVKTVAQKSDSPMIVNLTNSPPSYVYPKVADPSNLVFAQGETVTVFCPGKVDDNVVIKPGRVLIDRKKTKSSLENLAMITCAGDDEFKHENSGELFKFEEVSCENVGKAYSAIMKKSTSECSSGGGMYEIGFKIDEDRFLKTIDVCHDAKHARTLWAHGVIVPANQASIKYTAKCTDDFKPGGLYVGMPMSKKSPEEPYKLAIAFRTLTNLLGKCPRKYLSKKIKGWKYLAKGHLIAKADMLYKSEQESTYFYANAAPMWQRMNGPGGNWHAVEAHLRRLAFEAGRELDVYAGGVGVLELEGKKIYLYEGERIPVPRLLFKCVVFGEAKRQDLCFLVVNNPYVTVRKEESGVKPEPNEVTEAEFRERYVVCDELPMSEELFPKRKDIERGYLYSCSLQDFCSRNGEVLPLDDVANCAELSEKKIVSKKI